MKNRPVLIVLWLFIGWVLFATAKNMFSLFPEFSLNTTVILERSWFFLGFVIFSLVLWGIGWRSIFQPNLPIHAWFNRLRHSITRWPLTARKVGVVSILIIPTLLLLYTPLKFEAFDGWARLFFLLVAACIAGILLYPQLEGSKWAEGYVWLLLFSGAVFLAGKLLITVSDHPFSLGWSEGNRIWDYSTWLGMERYLLPEGGSINAFISEGRLYLWGLPFIIPGIGIWGVRLWDALVQITPSLLLGILLLPALTKGKRIRKDIFLFVIWAFLFIRQGPIYSHLIVSAILTAIGVRQKNLGLASLGVVSAGLYATSSRWIWSFAPGLWAGMIALLQISRPNFSRESWRELIRPVVLGLAGYVGGQLLPPLVFGGDVSFDVASKLSSRTFDQPLLWERWWSNSTFSQGIIPGIILVTAPVLLLLFLAWKRNFWKPNGLQIIGVSIPTLAFLAVGLVASVKIGGGGDLHNLDMFLISILILVAAAWGGIMKMLRQANTPGFILLASYAALSMPVLLNMLTVKIPEIPSPKVTQEVLTRIQEEVVDYQALGEVLFIDQRQLLTFGEIPDLPLIDDYEKKYLMDYALASDETYFEQFYTDLKAHRFSLIVTEKISIYQSHRYNPFGQENDLWVYWVAEPLLAYYEPIYTSIEVGVMLLVPKE